MLSNLDGDKNLSHLRYFWNKQINFWNLMLWLIRKWKKVIWRYLFFRLYFKTAELTSYLRWNLFWNFLTTACVKTPISTRIANDPANKNNLLSYTFQHTCLMSLSRKCNAVNLHKVCSDNVGRQSNQTRNPTRRPYI